MSNHKDEYNGEKANRMDSAVKAKQIKEAGIVPQSASAKGAQVMSTPGAKTKWPQQVKAAKSQWGKLSEAEILKSDGNSQQLTGLVEKRYDIAHDVAEKQVKSFLDKCSRA